MRAADKNCGRQNVPKILGRDEGDEKVNFVCPVRMHALTASGDSIKASIAAMGALDLDAPEVGAVFHEEVIAVAVAPGFGHMKAQGKGFGEEGRFGGFAHLLVGASAGGGLSAWVLVFELELRRRWRHFFHGSSLFFNGFPRGQVFHENKKAQR
jgi:hypothetical protein